MTSSYPGHCEVVPSELTILTTSECDAKCAHCLMRSSPERNDTLTLDQIIETVETAHAANPLLTVVFAGGEPTALGDDLLDAIAHVASLGIRTRLVTNATWAPTPADARAFVKTLRECGLDEINFSADDFHLPFIPLDNVINAWHACKGAGFESVVIALASGPRSKITPETMMAALGEEVALTYDEDGNMNPFPPPGPDGTNYLIANNYIYRIGRGRGLRETYARFPDDPRKLNQACPWAIRTAALSAKNHLVACCGIEAEGNEVLDFGRRADHDMTSLVAKANDDPLVLAIATLGPSHLMKRAQQFDPSLEFRPAYSAICEICEDVTTSPQAVAALRANANVIKGDVAAAKIVRLFAGETQEPTKEEAVAL
ncbi:MAG TPA: radical SAM protein [Streptosporangiaceae bacterium]|nr:radical SAM protein [Streptosporangiaceae bacterium]